jgi:hypothetical protein
MIWPNRNWFKCRQVTQTLRNGCPKVRKNWLWSKVTKHNLHACTHTRAPCLSVKFCSCTGTTLLMVACFVCCTSIIWARVSQESIRESRQHMHCSIFWDPKQVAYPVGQGDMDPWYEALCTVSALKNMNSNLSTNIRDILLKLNTLLWEIITDCMLCFFSFLRIVLHGISYMINT